MSLWTLLLLTILGALAILIPATIIAWVSLWVAQVYRSYYGLPSYRGFHYGP
jgi:hypothetical protein